MRQLAPRRLPCGLKCACLLAVVLAGCPAHAGWLPFDTESSLTLTGNYLFRGAPVSGLGVISESRLYLTKLPVQVSFGTWSYVRTENDWRSGESNYDLDLSGQVPGTRLVLQGGWRYYDRLRWLGPDRRELYLGGMLQMPGHPFVRAWYSYTKPLVGTYIELGGRQRFDVLPRIAVDLTGGLGFDLGRGIDVFNDAHAKATARFRVGRGLTVAPSLELVVPSHQVATYGAKVVPALTLDYTGFF